MTLLNLKEQRDIVAVINYLLEIRQKNNTVADVLKRFHLTFDEYRMCCNLAMPALALGNMSSRYTNIRRANKAMREDIKALCELADGEEGPLADGIRALHDKWCNHQGNVVYGSAEDEEDGERDDP